MTVDPAIFVVGGTFGLTVFLSSRLWRERLERRIELALMDEARVLKHLAQDPEFADYARIDDATSSSPVV